MWVNCGVAWFRCFTVIDIDRYHACRGFVLGAPCDGVTLYGALKLDIEKRAKTRIKAHLT